MTGELAYFMDLRHLRYFVAIVEHGSLTRAAASLHVAQPALSQSLRQLEEEMGGALLIRTARGVIPTHSGQRLAERARELLMLVADLREEVRGVEASPSGLVTVGIPTSLGMLLSVPLALEVRRTLPAVRLRIAEGLSGHTLEWLRGGEVDVALVFAAHGVPGLALTPVASESLHLVGPPGDAFLAARAAGVPFADLSGLPLIMPGRPHGVREEVESVARAQGVALQVVLEIDALEHIKALVAAGAGYTVLSERVAGSSVALSFAVITAPAIVRTIHLAHVRDRPLTAAARAVQALLAQQLAALTDQGRWRA